MWGQVIGSAFGAIASHIEGALNRHHSSKEARAADKRAYAAWQSQTLNGPSLERQALEQAGYNPLLAINGGSSFSMPSTHSGSSSSVPDVVGSAKQGAELMNEIMEGFKNRNDKDKAETNAINDATERANKTTEATIKNIDADTELKESQKTNTEKNTWLDNPIVAPITGALGYKAAEKIGGLFGGSAKAVSKAPIVKAWEAAKKGTPNVLGVGSKLLRGLSLPLLIGSAGVAGWEAAKKGKGKKLSEDKYFSHGNWSR